MPWLGLWLMLAVPAESKSPDCPPVQIEMRWATAQSGAFLVKLVTGGDFAEVSSKEWKGALRLTAISGAGCIPTVSIEARIGSRLAPAARERAVKGSRLQISPAALPPGFLPLGAVGELFIVEQLRAP